MASADCPDNSKCEPESQGYFIAFLFEENYSKIAGNEEQFKRNLLTVIKTLTNSTCLQDLETKEGSINVTFTVVPQKGQSVEDFRKAVTALETQITSGNFNVTLPSGETITADPASFIATQVSPPTTVASTVATTTESSDNKTMIIIICCVVGGVVLIVIIAVTAYCCIKKKKEGRVSPSASTKGLRENEDVEMRDRHVKDHPGEFVHICMYIYLF